jgi:hypothetical protein
VCRPHDVGSRRFSQSRRVVDSICIHHIFLILNAALASSLLRVSRLFGSSLLVRYVCKRDGEVSCIAAIAVLEVSSSEGSDFLIPF